MVKPKSSLMSEPFPMEAFEAAKPLLEGAVRVLIISHKNPDADTIGANLALREALENHGKTVSSACVHPVPDNCLFLKKADSFVLDFNVEDFDLIIAVDCGGHKLLAFQQDKPELLDRNRVKLLNIDHHPSNDYFGSINLVMPDAAATCFILFFFFSYLGWDITQSMATALMTGLYYDTGSFMHSNTSATVLRVGARLKALGADQEQLVKEQFHSMSIPKLRLWGRALESADYNENRAVVAVVTEKDFYDSDANYDDISGLVYYLNHVSNAKFCVLLTEDQKGNIKGSMRSQNEAIDLTKIAGLLGGGGHAAAAGFTVPGHLEEKRSWTVI